ncbi:MAG: BON domain-containing protein [Acidobacteriia bacterium]|nr:BON domain-containing protein [Terriglobia bacterium]
MLKTIRTITIIGCLMLPLASFGAGEPKGDRGAKFDRELAAKIHKSLAKDDSLKAYAAAVKVNVENGQVTLKGAVQSDEQSQDIQAKAESETIQVTPIDQIDTVVVHNELTVSPN